MREAGLSSLPEARMGMFVGNAWDPQEGRETPWIDIARQLAGDKGVEALGTAVRTTPPGTESIARVFKAESSEPFETPTAPASEPIPVSPLSPEPGMPGSEKVTGEAVTLRLTGTVPPEIWNRLGTKVLPKLRGGKSFRLGVEFIVQVDAQFARSTETDLRQLIEELGLGNQVRICISEDARRGGFRCAGKCAECSHAVRFVTPHFGSIRTSAGAVLS